MELLDLACRKHPANPVLPPGAPGSCDSGCCMNPHAVVDGDTYRLYYAGGDDDGGELEEGFEGGGVLAFAPAVDEGLGELALGDAFGDDGGAIGGGTVGLEGGDALGDGVVLACLGKDAGEGALDGGRIGVGIQGKGIADGGEAGGGCLEDGEPASKGVDGGGEAVGGGAIVGEGNGVGEPEEGLEFVEEGLHVFGVAFGLGGLW